MCQSCRDLWSLHQEILNETLSLGDITGNEICRRSYFQCQISEKGALKVKVVVRVSSNWYVIKHLKFILCITANKTISTEYLAYYVSQNVESQRLCAPT
jgi:hypothetical protein